MRRITQCRICKNKDLIFIGSLGKIAISNFTDKPTKAPVMPLELVYCPNCTLLQLSINIPRAMLYDHYWYKSAINPVIVKDLKEIGQKTSGTVIDIGANDGTLLKYSKGFYKIAVDPSDIKPVEGGRTTWINDYWENVDLKVKADYITAIACLYDLPNPNRFMKNIERHLSPDGIFITQMTTLEPTIENNDIGNICHEHLEYYSYDSIVRLFEQNGLEIFKVEKNKINGGSFRLYARHYRSGSIKFKEKKYGVLELERFFKRVERNKRDFFDWLRKKKSIFIQGYGASTKGNTILQYYGVRNIVIVDINPDKSKKYTIQTGCPIIPIILPLTEYLWVFPWGFLNYFRKKEKDYKGKWITISPKFKIW